MYYFNEDIIFYIYIDLLCPFSYTFSHKVFGQSQIIILMNVFPVT